jgi:FkbM family methyltransferase
MAPQERVRSAGKRLIQVYGERGYPLLPLTRTLRAPLRWLYHRSRYLRHDSRFHWRPNLLLGLHALLVREHPQDFRIYGDQLAFRSHGSVMSMQGYYVGEIERHLLDFVVSQLRPGFTMLDVGAHHGVFSCVVAHELRARGFAGLIHAFEPDPGNFALLAHNLRQNHLEGAVVLHQAAVSDRSGEEELVGAAGENSGNTLASTGDFAVDRSAGPMVTHRVAVTTLDSLMPTVGPVHFIKIDIQGAEPQALAGAAGIIARDRPVLAIEAVDGWPSSERTRAFLLAQGYRIHGVTREGRPCPVGSDEAFVTWDWIALPG